MGNEEKHNVDSSSSREDIDSKKSSLKGLSGLVETGLRRFRLIVPLFALMLLYLLGSSCIALALTPALYWVYFIQAKAQAFQSQFLSTFALAFALASGYFIYGFTLIFVLPLANFILRLRLRPWRGIYYSFKTVPWFFHNALTYLARYTFLVFITPTPFNVLFYRLMGMKIGRGTQINTQNISDPSLVELGEKVTIGGSVTIICHYGVGGYLILAPVRIEKGATIGIKATIMGDVEIGEKAKVLPHSVVMPKTRIPAGEVWGGVPAERIKKASDGEDRQGKTESSNLSADAKESNSTKENIENIENV